MTTRQLVSSFFRLKRDLRQYRAWYDITADVRRRAKRRLRKESFDAFTWKRAEERLNRLAQQERGLVATINKAELELVELIQELDRADELSFHDKAQLLSINHIALRETSAPTERLFDLAFFHGECAGEGEMFIGESGNRDYPVFEAIQTYMIKVFDALPAEKRLELTFGKQVELHSVH